MHSAVYCPLIACADKLFDRWDDTLAVADKLEQGTVAERSAAQEAENANRARELEEKLFIEAQRLEKAR